MKRKTGFESSRNIGYQLIYRYRPQENHIGRSLIVTPFDVFVFVQSDTIS